MGAFFNIAYTKYQTEKQGLLPCPFCGSEAHYANWAGGGGVYCTNCGAKILRDHSKGDDGLTYGADIAANAWNRRMNDDLISRQAAIDAIHSTIFDFFDIVDDDYDSPMTESDKRLLELNKSITTAIRRQPTIDPVKHGVWLKYPGTWVSDDGLWGETLHDCSECGWTKHIVTDFCPKCGANMVLNGEIQVRWKDATD